MILRALKNRVFMNQEIVTLLSLDAASTTGWAVLNKINGADPVLVDWGNIKARFTNNKPKQYRFLRKGIKDLITEYEPTHVAIEIANRSYHGARRVSFESTRGLCFVQGVVIEACFGVNKTYLIDAGWKGKNTKSSMLEKARETYRVKLKPEEHDAAEAIMMGDYWYENFFGMH